MPTRSARNRLKMDDHNFLIVDPTRGASPFNSKRRRLNIPQLPEELSYVCDGTESLWQIAGRTEVYGDARLWWVLADANAIHGIFSAMLDKAERGVELRVPSLDLVRRVVKNRGRL